MFPAKLAYLQWIAKLVLLAVSMAFAMINLTATLGFADNSGVGLIANEPVIAPISTQELNVVGDYLDRILLADKDHVDLIKKTALSMDEQINKGESYLASLDALEAKLQRGEALYRNTRAKLASKAEKLELEARSHARCVHHHEAEKARHPKESPAHAEHARRARLCRHQGAGVTKNIKLLQITAIDDDPFAKQRASLAAAREGLVLRMIDLEHASSAWKIRVESSQIRALLQNSRELLNRDISALGDEIEMELQRLHSMDAEFNNPE